MEKNKKTIKELSNKEKQQRIDEIHAFVVQHHTTQPLKVIEFLTEAIELCRDINNIPILIQSMSRKAFGLRKMLFFDEALALLEEALNISITHNLEKEQAQVCSNIAVIYYRKSKFQKAKEYFYKSAAMYEKVKEYSKQVLIITDLALMCFHEGESVEGFSCCQTAFTLCDTHVISPYPAALLHNTALIYESTGNMEKAVYYYNEAYNVALDSGDKQGQSMSLQSIAGCYSQTKNPEQVLPYMLQAIELHRDINILPEKQSLYITVAEIFCELHQQEKAYEFLEKAWNLCKEKTQPSQKFDYLRVRASLLIEEKKYSEANLLLEEGLTIAKNYNMPFDVISTYKLKGKIPPVEDQIESLLTALHLSETHVIKQAQPNIHHELSALYESAGDIEKSFMHFKKYYELKERIQAEKHVVQMEIANMQHDAEKARQEAALLKVEKEFMEKEIASNKQQFEEITRDVIEKNQLLATIKNKLTEAIRQQGLKQKTTLSEIINITQHGATSLWLQLEERAATVGGNMTKKLLHLCPELTPVELRILVLLQRGMSNKEISQVLFISDRTVLYYRTGIRKKLRLEKDESLLAFLNCL